MCKSNLVIAFSILVCLFCGCSLAIKAHEGEEHEEVVTASLLDGLWSVRKKIGICVDSAIDEGLQANIKFHVGHVEQEAATKLILNFCSDDNGNLLGFVNNQNRLEDFDTKYQVTELNIDNEVFYITSQSEDLDELNIEIINLEDKSLNVSFGSEFDGFGCFYEAKKIKAKPSRACAKLLNEN